MPYGGNILGSVTDYMRYELQDMQAIERFTDSEYEDILTLNNGHVGDALVSLAQKGVARALAGDMATLNVSHADVLAWAKETLKNIEKNNNDGKYGTWEEITSKPSPEPPPARRGYASFIPQPTNLW